MENNNEKDNLDSLLNFDPIDAAEKITGLSAKDNTNVGLFGLLLHMEKSDALKNALIKENDVYFGEPLDTYLQKLIDFGFEIVLKDPFKNDNGGQEYLYVLFHFEYSILLTFDTYSGDSVNGGKFYYNFALKNGLSSNGLTSSGHYLSDNENNHVAFYNENFEYFNPKAPKVLRYEGKVTYEEWKESCKIQSEFLSKVEGYKIWSGDHDCRKAVKHTINKIAETGKFLKYWKEQPYLWFLTYMDTKTEGYDAINAERIAKLPEEVQKRIKGE